MKWVVTSTDDMVGISPTYLPIMIAILLFMDSNDQVPLHMVEDARKKIVDTPVTHICMMG